MSFSLTSTLKTIVRLLIAAAAVGFSASCARVVEEGSVPGIPMREYVFKADVESTKTTLDGLKVKWEENDTVNVYYKYLDGEALKKSSSKAGILSLDGSSAVFVVKLPETAVLDTLYAAYRHYDGQAFRWKSFKKGITFARVEFKSVQAAIKGSFDRKAAPMVSRWVNSGDGEIAFRFSNLSGLLKLDVDNKSSDPVDSIVFRSSANTIGRYYWGFKPGTDEVLLQQSTKGNSVKLVGPFIGSGSYYIALPYSAESYSDISLSFHSGKKFRTLTNPEELTVERNNIYPLGEFTVTDDFFPDPDPDQKIRAVFCSTKDDGSEPSPEMTGRIECNVPSLTGLSAGFEYVRLSVLTKSSPEGWSDGGSSSFTSEQDDEWNSVGAPLSQDFTFKTRIELDKGFVYAVRAWAQYGTDERVYSNVLVYRTLRDFSVSVDKSERTGRDTMYMVDIVTSPDRSWTISSDDPNVKIDKASGKGNAGVPVQVPVNHSWGKDVFYDLTVSSPDGSTGAVYSKTITLVQKRLRRVLFGTSWDNEFFNSWMAEGWKSGVEFSYGLATASVTKSSGQGLDNTSGACLYGAYSFSFVSGETGVGELSFRATIYASGGNKKTLSVTRNGTVVFSKSVTSSYTESFIIPDIEVNAGDVIKIACSGSSYHRLYCCDRYPITWTGK